MADRRTLLFAAVLAIAASLVILALPVPVGHAWLAAAFFWSGVPVGSIGLTLMMRLIGGRWREALGSAVATGHRALPIVALGFVPVLVGLMLIYPWVAMRPDGFKAIWLTSAFFIVRTLVWFGGLGAILWGLGRGRDTMAATFGLIFLIPMGSLIAVDWLQSLDPEFHSSAFGLQVLSIQFTVALMVAVLRQPADRSGTTGALMLTLLMLWGYFAYLPFFIIWSGNAPPGAAWYGARGSGGWGVVAAIASLAHAIPLLALLSPTARRSPVMLRSLAWTVLAGDTLQAAWLVLPVDGPIGVQSIAVFAVAWLLIGYLAWKAAR